VPCALPLSHATVPVQCSLSPLLHCPLSPPLYCATVPVPCPLCSTPVSCHCPRAMSPVPTPLLLHCPRATSLVPINTDCFNYVRFLQSYNSSHLYACGTYAFQPKCTYIVSGLPKPAPQGPLPSLGTPQGWPWPQGWHLGRLCGCESRLGMSPMSPCPPQGWPWPQGWHLGRLCGCEGRLGMSPGWPCPQGWHLGWFCGCESRLRVSPMSPCPPQGHGSVPRDGPGPREQVGGVPNVPLPSLGTWLWPRGGIYRGFVAVGAGCGCPLCTWGVPDGSSGTGTALGEGQGQSLMGHLGGVPVPRVVQGCPCAQKDHPGMSLSLLEGCPCPWRIIQGCPCPLKDHPGMSLCPGGPSRDVPDHLRVSLSPEGPSRDVPVPRRIIQGCPCPLKDHPGLSLSLLEGCPCPWRIIQGCPCAQECHLQGAHVPGACLVPPPVPPQELSGFTLDPVAFEDGKGKCPYDPTKGHTGLIVGSGGATRAPPAPLNASLTDGELYSATFNNFLGTEPVILRNLGPHYSVKTEYLTSWLNGGHGRAPGRARGGHRRDQVLLQSLTSWRRPSSGDDDKVYFFFSERAVEYDCYAEQVVARVARVCKVRLGTPGGTRGHVLGSLRAWAGGGTVCGVPCHGAHGHHGGPVLVPMVTTPPTVAVPAVPTAACARQGDKKWTSFLKARLVCSAPEQQLHFNRLQAVFTLPGARWQDTAFFGCPPCPAAPSDRAGPVLVPMVVLSQ
ncbi:hypothetical protein DV515_00019393, partial [Chloebia gouldiae]